MFKALQSYGRAITFLGNHGLTWFLLFPFIITALVFVIGLSATSATTDFIFTPIEAWLSGVDWMPDWLRWLVDVFYWILWIILRIALFFIMQFIGGSVILLLMSPILTWLSEKVAIRLGRPTPAFSMEQFFYDLVRAIGMALRNGVIQLMLNIGCFLLGFVPVVGVVTPFLLFFINAYFYGINFMDYTLERKRMSMRESTAFAWKKRYKTLGIGTPFAAWMVIPILGPLTAGFVAILSTVAGTLLLEEDELAIEAG